MKLINIASGEDFPLSFNQVNKTDDHTSHLSEDTTTRTKQSGGAAPKKTPTYSVAGPFIKWPWQFRRNPSIR